MATPDSLGTRGAGLWKALKQTSETTPAGVLAIEACRTADRLELLEELIASGDLTVLQEARLQASHLKVLLESPVLKVEDKAGGSPVDQLASARAARRASAAQGS